MGIFGVGLGAGRAPASSWRAVVRNQARRLDHEMRLVPEAQRASPYFVEAKEALESARATVERPASLGEWWSGSQVEDAWANLQAARAALVMVQDEVELRAQLPYVATFATSRADADPTGRVIDTLVAGKSIDRPAVRQLIQQHDLTTESRHAALRQLRNRSLGVTLLLAAVVLVAAFVADPELRKVMAIGAVAGSLTSILPIVTSRVVPGSYSVAGAQALLKVPAGAAAALLGVLLLRPGLGGLRPATGDAAVFYAVLLGVAQQALTGLVDRHAEAVAENASLRQGMPSPG